MKNEDFDQRLECVAPKRLSKYTTHYFSITIGQRNRPPIPNISDILARPWQYDYDRLTM